MAVNEKKKLSVEGTTNKTIKTKLVKPPLGGLGAKGGLGVNYVEISVTDNGPGIPQKVLDRKLLSTILYYETHRSGNGSWGLSLGYDIYQSNTVAN